VARHPRVAVTAASAIIVVDDESLLVMTDPEGGLNKPSVRSYLYIGERVVESFFREWWGAFGVT
jgi:hypothetical protein